VTRREEGAIVVAVRSPDGDLGGRDLTGGTVDTRPEERNVVLGSARSRWTTQCAGWRISSERGSRKTKGKNYSLRRQSFGRRRILTDRRNVLSVRNRGRKRKTVGV